MTSGSHLSHAHVIATLGFFLAVGLAFFTATAPAQAEVYEGHVKGVPGTELLLRVYEANPGKRVVRRLDYRRVPFSCDDGPHVFSGADAYFSPENRVRGGAFDIRVDDAFYNVRLAGELKRGHHAAGTYKQRVDLGLPWGVCKTGKLEWVAQKP